jgi:hypothetical protein
MSTFKQSTHVFKAQLESYRQSQVMILSSSEENISYYKEKIAFYEASIKLEERTIELCNHQLDVTDKRLAEVNLSLEDESQEAQG